MSCMHSWDIFRINSGIFPDQLRYYQGLKKGFDMVNQNTTTQVVPPNVHGTSQFKIMAKKSEIRIVYCRWKADDKVSFWSLMYVMYIFVKTLLYL